MLSISISIREAAMFCLTCIGQVFATLSLIYWPACLIIVCMYLINTRVFRKKKTIEQSIILRMLARRGVTQQIRHCLRNSTGKQDSGNDDDFPDVYDCVGREVMLIE